MPSGPLKDTLDSMEARGIKTRYGRWLIDGAPRVLLFDTSTGYKHLDEWKGDLWNVGGIPSPPGDDETNEAVVFGYLIAWFLGEVSWIPSGMTPHRASFRLSVPVTNDSVVFVPREVGCDYRALPRVARWCRFAALP